VAPESSSIQMSAAFGSTACELSVVSPM